MQNSKDSGKQSFDQVILFLRLNNHDLCKYITT